MKTNPVLQAYRDTLKKLYVAKERELAKRPDCSNKKLVVIEEEIGEVSRIVYQLERKEQL